MIKVVAVNKILKKLFFFLIAEKLSFVGGFYFINLLQQLKFIWLVRFSKIIDFQLYLTYFWEHNHFKNWWRGTLFYLMHEFLCSLILLIHLKEYIFNFILLQYIIWAREFILLGLIFSIITFFSLLLRREFVQH